MIHEVRVCTSALLLALGSAAQLASVESLLEPSAESIDEIFDAEIGADTPGCAVGVFYEQEILYQASFGLASLAAC